MPSTLAAVFSGVARSTSVSSSGKTSVGDTPRAIIRSAETRRTYVSRSRRARITCGRLLLSELSSTICSGALRPASNSLP